MKNPELKKQFEEDFIPRVEKMLESEKAHYNMLSMALIDNGDVSLYGWNKKLSDCINFSQLMVDHFEERIKEYKEYAKNL